MSKDSSKDLSSASLPGGDIKFSVRGRNALALRVTLGRRIMLTEFFGTILQAVADDGKAQFGPGDVERLDKWIGLFVGNAANVMRVIGDQYSAIVKDCTDIDSKWMEDTCELEDLATIFKAIWDANGFSNTIKALQSAGGKKKEVSGASGGSKST